MEDNGLVAALYKLLELRSTVTYCQAAIPGQLIIGGLGPFDRLVILLLLVIILVFIILIFFLLFTQLLVFLDFLFIVLKPSRLSNNLGLLKKMALM